MKFSKHNIISKIKNSDKHFIVNQLSGNADFLENSEFEELMKLKNEEISNSEFAKKLIENGYIVDETEENKEFKNKYFDFIDERDSDEIQLFLVLNYSCNFACSYCYQDEYSNQIQEPSKEIIDAFFEYLKIEFANRKKYITLFGGEPLLTSNKQKELVKHLILKANEANLELCIVTNGYSLTEYVEILREAKIREIQITLDGTQNIHDKRRFLKGGATTFKKIVEGIDACLENQLPVNLRMVVDKENIENLPDFAQFAIDKTWTKNPFFKTQMGRNYELHHCQSSPDKLFSRVTLYEKIFELIQKHPHILEFHKPAFSIAKYISENGELPIPLFDACPACKTEWAFDYTGSIYSCTATVGKADEKLGTFYPVISKNNDVIEEWENRDVTSIPECKTCNLQLACGGGCGSVAKNKTGKILSPDCRPVKELLELGFSAYFES